MGGTFYNEVHYTISTGIASSMIEDFKYLIYKEKYQIKN